MYETAYVELFRIGNTVYCAEKLYEVNSYWAKEANRKFHELIIQGYNTVDVKEMSDEDKKNLIDYLDEEIQKREQIKAFDVMMHVKKSDLFNVFNEDGTSKIPNLQCATNEIMDLLNNPDSTIDLETISSATFVTCSYSEGTKYEDGLIIPMTTYGDFFSELDVRYPLLNCIWVEKKFNKISFKFQLNEMIESKYCELCDKFYTHQINDEESKLLVQMNDEKYNSYVSNFNEISDLKYIKKLFLEATENSIIESENIYYLNRVL